LGLQTRDSMDRRDSLRALSISTGGETFIVVVYDNNTRQRKFSGRRGVQSKRWVFLKMTCLPKTGPVLMLGFWYNA